MEWEQSSFKKAKAPRMQLGVVIPGMPRNGYYLRV